MDASFTGTKRFEIIRRLGKGGMGVVYEARDRENLTTVALKTLRNVSGDDLLRLKNEFRALQDLQHRNLVRLEELVEDQGHYFITMELIDGCDFLEYVTAREPLPNAPDTLAVPGMFDDLSSGYATSPTHDVPDRAVIGAVDTRRLCNAVRQLAHGLRALHDADLVHRDVKPSNSLVTHDDRLVLLDFGLIAPTTGDQNWSDDDVVGTVAYMAPEQAASMQVGPEADLYSLGVMVYEALTGTLPFTGGYLEVLAKKQIELPRPPLELVPDLPRPLDALCMDLLQTNPRARPSIAEVLDRLEVIDRALSQRAPGLPSTWSEPSLTPVPSPHALPFVGRQREMRALADAFADTRRGACVTVLLTGESGLGKSTIARRYTTRLPLEHPGAVVLAGRCYEQEAVPYKALDGVIDELSLFLSRLSDTEAGSLAPRRAQLLCQVFPVLGRVSAIANAPRQSGTIRDPHELRGRVFAALRELLSRLARRQPLVIYIDDIQWTDADSLAMLGELLRPPDAPPLLLLATARDIDPGAGGVDAAKVALALPGDIRQLRIERLTAEESEELTDRLLRATPGLDVGSARAIALEAGGHPMFIDELIRHAGTQPGATPHISLEDALWARIGLLEPEERELLRMVCVASGPLSQRVAQAAAELSPTELARATRVLRTTRLARTTGLKISDLIEPYHDRVRAAVRSHMSEDERVYCHRTLAQTMEADSGDAEALAFHWRAAGERDVAARYAAQAASLAAEALAFDRAAGHFRHALELPSLPPAERAALCAGLGEVLCAAGRGADAAGAFMDAAAVADDAEAVDLRRRAAEQLLRSGHRDEGFQILRDVLVTLGMELPDTRRSSLAAIVKHRAWLRLHGLRFRDRSEDALDLAERMRIDVCWSVAAGMAMVDPIVGYQFHSLNLRLALRAGEPYRLSRALSLEAVFLAARGAGTRAVNRVRGLAGELAEKSGRPHALGLVTMARGMDYFWRGHWKPAVEWLDRADRVFREEWTGVVAGSPTSRVLALWSLFYVGELDELFRRIPAQLRQAEDRDDLQTAVNIGSGVSHLAALAADDPAKGAATVTAYIERWQSDTFHFQHFVSLIARTEIDLYRDASADALARLDEAWPVVRASQIFRTQKMRIDWYLAHARASLAAARTSASTDVAGHLRTATRALRKVEGEQAPWASPLATLGLAAIADIKGDADLVTELLSRAVAGFREVNMGLHERAAYYRQGCARGGSRGRAMRRETIVWLEHRGVAQPERFLRMVAPGFSDPAD